MSENPYRVAAEPLREDPVYATLAGGRHSATQVQRARDDQPLPGAGSFALLGLAVVATMVGLGVEFDALPVPHLTEATWLPRVCLVVALLAGFAGTRFRWRRTVDLVLGLVAAGLFLAGSVDAMVRVDGLSTPGEVLRAISHAKPLNGLLGVGFALLVVGLMALERSFAPKRPLHDPNTAPDV